MKDVDEVVRVAPRERDQQPLGRNKISSPLGTAGISFRPEPENIETEKKKKNEIIQLLLTSVESASS